MSERSIACALFERIQQVDAYARSFANRTRYSIGETDRLLLLLLRHNWAVSGGRTRLAGTIEAGIFSQQYIAAVGLVDRNGIILTASHPSAIGLYAGNQPYFTAQQRAGADCLYVSGPLLGQLSKRELIAFR